MSHTPRVSHGLYIKRTREKHGLSQPQLADALGVDQGNLSRIESGQRLLPSEHYDAIKKALPSISTQTLAMKAQEESAIKVGVMNTSGPRRQLIVALFEHADFITDTALASALNVIEQDALRERQKAKKAEERAAKAGEKDKIDAEAKALAERTSRIKAGQEAKSTRLAAEDSAKRARDALEAAKEGGPTAKQSEDAIKTELENLVRLASEGKQIPDFSHEDEAPLDPKLKKELADLTAKNRLTGTGPGDEPKKN